MIVILKPNPDKEQYDNLIAWLESLELHVHLSAGTQQTIMGLVGDTAKVDIELIQALDIVKDVKRIMEPYKEVNRAFHPDASVISIGETKVGGGNFAIIAGPCSIESEEQILEVAKDVKAAGATMLRGGAFKPRTSPYAFQGLHEKGLEFLLEAGRATKLPVVTEIMDLSQLPLFDEVEVIQVGARNMQNFEMLRALGKTQKTVLLKRGLSSTIEEFLMSAEYILAGGNKNVILCERGIRTFSDQTRNTLDLSAVPVLKAATHLPVIVDPSHATGKSELVLPMALAATVSGADGLMIEVHNNPSRALCDGRQSITPEEFTSLTARVKELIPFAWTNEKK